ncbi:MAG: O-methyltransferase, family 2 [Betaproteobacteria bacterium]|nr:O-methyltransferase, family 2 [Betaproteobacteria bacterium]
MEPALPPPAHVQVMQMATGYLLSRAIYVAARLGIADLLADGAKTADELAQSTETHAPSLYRLMRTLASVGYFKESADHRFTLDELGAALRTDAPGAARSSVLALSGQWIWKAWEEFLYTVKTGETAFDKVFGVSLFGYLAQHPAEAKLFGEAMIGFHGSEPPAVADAYDFSDVSTLVDIGGGTGNLLGTILRRNERIKGIVYDLAHVVPEALKNFRAWGIADRASAEPGSFFESVPAGADAYLLSHVIHDWDEEKCLTILRNCRAAMRDTSRLLIVEYVLPSGNAPHLGKILDLMMLTVPGGMERSDEQYRELLSNAGLHLTRIIPTATQVSVIEAIRA